MFTGISILKIKTVDENTGLQRANFDGFSKYKSMYSAPTNNYTNLIEFITQETETEVIKNTRLREDQYLIFKVNNGTNSAMYNYGKIYPLLRYGRFRDSGKYEVHFTYYYNSTPDDRNLEFDPKKNLIKTYDKRGKDNSDRFKP